jgi:(5-formylfuran-3-yl)methyl phosphate synthase
MRLLVSVRSVEEALIAARGGADLIDCKEPSAGALGGLPAATIRAIVAALREHSVALPVSATIGDLPATALDAIEQRVREVGDCGVRWVKVGVAPGADARELLDRLAVRRAQVVPVLIADGGLDTALAAHALALGFPMLMADTADKRAGSLLDAVPPATLHTFVRHAREAGAQVGLAGALRAADARALAAIGPDFAGFRSAVCDGPRDGVLDAARLQALRAALA